jgi:FixJ family two-component response regulator
MTALATGPLPPPIIHVVDDDASFRTAISRLVRAGRHEVQCYPSAVEFLAVPVGNLPGCVLADLHMPGPSGLDLQQVLAKAEHPLPVIFLTGHGDIPISVQAMRGGAEDFLTKPVKKDLLFAAINRALARDARERAARAERREWQGRYDTLTPREREVMALVVAGNPNKQIAGDLGTVERTVKAHRAHIMEKMQVASLAELVRVSEHLTTKVIGNQ